MCTATLVNDVEDVLIMLRLDLTSEPRWLDLGHGVRLRAAPLTTALMVASRSDPAPSRRCRTASDEERALVFAKAIARRAVTDWEGVGDADGNPCRSRPRASTRCSRSGRSSRRSRRPTSRRACCWMRKKTPPRPRRLALRRGRPLLRGLRGHVPGLPGAAEPAADLEGWQVWDLVGRLGGQLRVIPGAVIGWDMGAALALAPRARHRHPRRRRAAAGDRGGDGAPAQRGDPETAMG